MNKIQILFFITFVYTITSCSFKNETISKDTIEDYNSIAVIIDDHLWNGEVGDSIRNNFASPVLGLPQEEPLFTITQYPAKLFDGFNSTKRNIISIKKASENKFELKTDEYTTPQNIFYISGVTNEDILCAIEEQTQFMIQKMRAIELTHYQKVFSDSLLEDKNLSQKFKIELQIPKAYKFVREKPNFVWLKKEFIGGNTSLIIYEVPWKKISTTNPINDIIKIRDSIGSIHIRGAVYGTRMITEEAYSPYFSETTLAGCKTFETKGTWQMKNDFMSGPFINYALFDKVHRRILVMEGFCYAPSKRKRDMMTELEAIIKSIQIVK